MGEAEMKQIAAWMDRVVGNPDDATADRGRAARSAS